ncbi:hypothetical protein C8R47DRAFT_1160885 [Mycena vitilis]|nr:hypothetical protein C8R47DRAFT_1160885 [Mycena vitilis]
MSASIVFYDLPSTLPSKTLSPNLWKTRYALNFKGLPHKTVWLEYPEIAPLCREIGAAPTSTKPGGSPHFTLPVIHDLSTGAVISDSTNIATYLDATYPDKPRLMPAGTLGLHRAFEDTANDLLVPLYPYVLPPSHAKFNPPSAEYFRRTREESWGKTLEDFAPKGEDDIIEWNKVKEGFGKVDGWIRANGEGSAYIMGDALCYADMWIAAYALWIKLVLPERWEEVRLWHQGRWGKLVQEMEKYAMVT